MNRKLSLLYMILTLLVVAECEKPRCASCIPDNYDQAAREIISMGLNPIRANIVPKAPAVPKSESYFNDIASIDIYVFDSETELLDIHRRFRSISEMEKTPIAVGTGARTFVVLVNMPEASLESDTLKELSYQKINAGDEGLDKLWWGSADIEINGAANLVFDVQRYYAEINVRSISTRFDNSPAEMIEDASVYVLNAPASVSWLGESDLTKRVDRLIVTQLGNIEDGTELKNIASFQVFEKCDGIDTAGNKAIYVTIEGTIAGTRYYWPVPVNFNAYGEGMYEPKGISANTVYNLDITITGKGGNSPDTPLSFINISISCEIAGWGECISEITL